MRPDSARWVEVSPCRYPHERDGLSHIGERLPDRDPYRLWTNIQFRYGSENLELDALVLGPGGLYVLELKYYQGQISGDDYTWRRRRSGRKDSERDANPFIRANLKALKLAEHLKKSARKQAQRTGKSPAAIPWVQAAIFLHHPEVRCELPQPERERERTVFGLDDMQDQTGLPGIMSLLTRHSSGRTGDMTANQAAKLNSLVNEIGICRPAVRDVADYILGEKPIAEGPGWQDYLGTHKSFPDDQKRVRCYNTSTVAGQGRRRQFDRAAMREYRLQQQLSHPAILSPQGFHNTELGPALVYPYDPRARRLDLVLEDDDARSSMPTRLRIIRGIAEALRYAHDRGVTHRGLAPQSVLVSGDGHDATVKVTDWQSAAVLAADAATAESLLEGTTNVEALLADDTRWCRAPEIGTASRPDPVRADMFSLGAIAYALLGGSIPATGRTALRTHLTRDGGLRLTDSAAAVPPGLADLVYQATRANAGARIPDFDTFCARFDTATSRLAIAEQAPTGATGTQPSLAEAAPGTVFAARWRLVRELGRGSTACAFLVEDTAEGNARKVVKVARGPDAEARLLDEASTLARLNHPSIVRLAAGPVTIGDKVAVVTEQAGEQTLAALLRTSAPLSPTLLERLGSDLLEAAAFLAERGVHHRDIKPANLGVRGDPQRLVLFDFSHSSVPLDAIEAGTPLYRDPFLGPHPSHGLPPRPHWDQAAEQYAVAVTLFEMATGKRPQYGDGLSDPQTVPDEALITADMFPSLPRSQRAEITGFFQRALLRDARRRFPDVAAMRAAWPLIFYKDDRAARRIPGRLPRQPDRAAPSRPAASPATAAPEPSPRPGRGSVRQIPAQAAISPSRLRLRRLRHMTAPLWHVSRADALRRES